MQALPDLPLRYQLWSSNAACRCQCATACVPLVQAPAGDVEQRAAGRQPGDRIHANVQAGVVDDAVADPALVHMQRSASCLQRERVALCGSEEAIENMPFTPAEREEIAWQFPELKLGLAHSHWEAQVRVLDERLDYLVDAARRLGRRKSSSWLQG